MKIKTAEASDLVLDWLVAKCQGRPELYDFGRIIPWTTKLAPSDGTGRLFSPTTDWAQGGPIIERERICPDYLLNGQWLAVSRLTEKQGYGPTPLIAAMRCVVASKLGDEVEIPEELA